MTKKSFINDVVKEYNPAEAFLSKAPAETLTPSLKDKDSIEAELKAERERRNKPRLDKRLNLLLTQALYEDLTDLSRFDGKSVNSIINEALTELTTARKDDIQKIRSL